MLRIKQVLGVYLRDIVVRTYILYIMSKVNIPANQVVQIEQ